MSALLVLPQAELARLREAAGASGATALDTHALAARARHERRLQLKQRSDARVAGWSDTIEAKQERKLQWRVERREREEAERARLDREEEALEAAEKAETLARARALLFEQTDAMKTLRSAQRYAAILKVCIWNGFENTQGFKHAPLHV